jgi:hypothetical protein
LTLRSHTSQRRHDRTFFVSRVAREHIAYIIIKSTKYHVE